MKTTSKNSLFSNILTVCLGFGMFLYCACLRAQYNLVQNPSFEIITACPNNGGQIDFAPPWGHLITGGGQSPDLYNSCDTVGYNGVPCNGLPTTCQEAKTGNGYAAFAPFLVGSIREYLQGKLNNKLRQNTTYCVKVAINLMEQAPIAIDEFGIYFDDGSVQTQGNGTILLSPQVKSPTNLFLSDTVNWMEVSGTFTATGVEEYFTLGNFRSNQNTNYIVVNNNTFLVSFYYIDDVSVIESDLPAYAGRDTALASASDSVFLGREPEIGLECVWYDMQGNQIGTGAGFWAHPTHTTSYIVEQNLCGNIKRDTVTVSLGVDISESAVLQGLSISPNPTQGTFRVSAPFSEAVQVQLLEISGKLVYEGKHVVIDSGFSVNVSGLAQGVYVLQVQDVRTGVSVVRRVLVE